MSSLLVYLAALLFSQITFNMKCLCRARWLKSALWALVRRDNLLTTPLSAKHTATTPLLPNPPLEPGNLSAELTASWYFWSLTSQLKKTMWNISPGNRVAKPRSAERCTAWRRGTCGAQRAAGRRPASASLTELYPLAHFKTCSFIAAVPRIKHRYLLHNSHRGLDELRWCPSEACGLLNVTDSSRPRGGALFLLLP